MTQFKSISFFAKQIKIALLAYHYIATNRYIHQTMK